MRPRFLIGLAAVLLATVGGVAVEVLRRRRELAGKVRRAALPPAPETGESPAQATDEPLARETRFDERLDEEEQRRHAAARRLQADPLGERLEEERP